MKKIPLTGKHGIGKYALIDDSDFDLVNVTSWRVGKNGYVSGHIDGTQVYLHRYITGTPDNMHTDHINGNRLDNQSSNLRVCTQQENNKNLPKKAGNTTGYKGVFRTGKNRYRAQISVNNKSVFLGCYNTAEEAAYAYMIASKKYHKDYSRPVTELWTTKDMLAAFHAGEFDHRRDFNEWIKCYREKK